MFQHLKDIGEKMVLYGLGDSLNKAIGFFMIPLYTAYLSPRDYGIIEMMDIVIAIVSIFLQSGINATIFRFYHSYQSSEQKCLISTALFGFPAIGLLMLAPLALFTGNLADFLFKDTALSLLFNIVIFTIWFDSIIIIFNTYILAQQKAIFFNVFSSLRVLLGLSLNIYFLIIKQTGYIGILYSGLISAACAACFGFVYTFVKTGMKFSWVMLWDLYKFGAPLIPAGLGSVVNNFSDRFFLNRLASTADVGIYSLAYKFGSIISQLVTSPFLKIWATKRFQIFESEKNPAAIFAKVFTYFLIVIFFIALLLAVNIKEVVGIMANSRFHSAATVVPLVLLAYIIRSAYYHFNIGIYIAKQTKIIGALSAVTIPVNIGLNILLIPRFGMLGAGVVLICSFLFEETCVLFLSQRQYRVPYEWWTIGKLFLVVVFIFVAVGKLVYLSNPFLSIAGKSVIVLLGYPALLLIIGVIKKEEFSKAFVGIRK